LLIQNPGHTPISIISVTNLTGYLLNQLLSTFGNDFNCGCFRLIANQLLLTCVNNIGAIPKRDRHAGKRVE